MVEIAQSIHCPNCGAPLEIETGEVIITCEFCGSNCNLATGKKYFLKHGLIPSAYDQNTAKELVLRWMGQGFLKPKDLARASQIKEIDLKYIPFFVYRVTVRSIYKGVFTRTGANIPREGKLEKDYYWKIIARRGSEFPTKEYEIPLRTKIPFEISSLPKDMTFLNSEMDEDAANNILRRELEEHQKFLLDEEVDVIQTINTDLDVHDTEFVHAPVFFIRYVYKGSDYRMIMDGAQGIFLQGDIPTTDDISNKGLFGGIKRGLFGK